MPRELVHVIGGVEGAVCLLGIDDGDVVGLLRLLIAEIPLNLTGEGPVLLGVPVGAMCLEVGEDDVG